MGDWARAYGRLGIIDGGVGPALADWVIGQWSILDDNHVDANHGTFVGGLLVAGKMLNPRV